MNDDDYVSFSPSTHAVPCSPFLRSYQASPAPCVPDVDRIVGRRLQYHQFTDCWSPHPISFSQSSQSSQPSNSLQQIPATPVVDCTSNKSTKEKLFLEQVVPSCSPFLVPDEKPLVIDESSQEDGGKHPFIENSSQEDCSKQCDEEESQQDSAPPDDEKPPVKESPHLQRDCKREIRTMKKTVTINPTTEYFKSDDIFG